MLPFKWESLPLAARPCDGGAHLSPCLPCSRGILAISPKVSGDEGAGASGDDEGQAASPRDGTLRYAGFGARLGKLLSIVGRTAKAGSRYVAYSSDVGEAFRPVVSPGAVRFCYALSYTYIAADVGITTYKEHEKTNGDQNLVARKAAETLTFQLLASLAVPAVIIHSSVHFVQSAVAKSANATLRKWAPTAVGLAIIPLLPFTIDEPLEHLNEYVFDTVWPIEDGKNESR